MRDDGCLTLANYGSSLNVLHRLDRTFKAFFARVNRGENPGFPRFKSSRRYDSITFPKYGNGCKLLDNGKLRIQGAGHVKVKLHRPIEGKIKTVTIKRQAGKWYACFSVECVERPLPISVDAVGVDLGLSSFAVLSNGIDIPNPRWHRTAQAKLRVAQRRLARRKNKRSSRRHKAVLLLKRAYAKVVNQRADFQHKLSRDIVNRFGVIAIEDLAVKRLSAGMLAKSIHDAGWAQFFKFLTYKAENAGRELVKVDPSGTSQTCTCGQLVRKRLKDRWHQCPACGVSANRDHISAQVILQRAGNRPSVANVGAVMPCVGREAVA